MTQTTPQCSFCKHFHRDKRGIATCNAYPSETGIPRRILWNQHDHRQQYHGDHGIRFEPVDDEAAEFVEAMFGEDDR